MVFFLPLLSLCLLLYAWKLGSETFFTFCHSEGGDKPPVVHYSGLVCVLLLKTRDIGMQLNVKYP